MSQEPERAANSTHSDSQDTQDYEEHLPPELSIEAMVAALEEHAERKQIKSALLLRSLGIAPPQKVEG